jgi:TRAP-type C4-dicarboxylate transport system substrate-binding protein
MRIRTRLALVILLITAAAAASREVHAQAARVIKLATVVPDGSVWDHNLKQMADEWKQATAGRVTVTIFGGASQGDESTVLRKMRLDALQAASFTAVGLGSIDAAFTVFDVPFFFESYDELNYVTAKLTPVITRRLDAKGFVFLNWGHGGWTQLFTKRPVKTLADLKTIKLYTSAGNDRMVQWFKANGFEPRPMAMTDIMTGLTTGMIEGLPTPALAAQLFQWYRQTPYMLDIGLAPVVGASVMTKKAWNSIPAADRPALLASAGGVEKRLQTEVPKQDQAAVAELTKRGVTITKAEGAEWRTQADALAKTMRGEMVPPDIFDLALQARADYRKQRPAGSPAR